MEKEKRNRKKQLLGEAHGPVGGPECREKQVAN